MRPAKRVAVLGIAVLLPLAIYLSYVALVDVASRSGVGHYESLAWPVIVDGVAIVATVAAYSLRGAKGDAPREGYRYSWTLLIASALVSAAANAAHLLLPPGPMPQWAVAGVALVPPIAIVVVAHLTVILARDTATPTPPTQQSRTDTGPAASVPVQPRPAAELQQPNAERMRHPQLSAPAAPIDDTTPEPHRPYRTAPEPTPDAAPTPLPHAALEPDAAPHSEDEFDRVAEAARLRREGLSFRKIGDELGVSEKTVRRDVKLAQAEHAV